MATLTQMYNPQGITLDTMQRIAPSVFAEHAAEDRSARYTFLPTVRVVERMMQEGFYPVSVAQSRARLQENMGYARHVVRFRHRGQNELRAVGDIIPEIVLHNSHDGTSSYEISAGLFRLACLNGMVVPTGKLGGLKVRHSGDIAGQVIEASYKVIGDIPQITSRAADFQAITLTGMQTSAYTRAAQLLRWDNPEESPLVSHDALNLPHRYEDRGADLWRTFNRVQENLLRGGVSRRQTKYENGRYKGLRGVNSVGENLRINKALWTLTEALAGHVSGQAPLVAAQ